MSHSGWQWIYQQTRATSCDDEFRRAVIGRWDRMFNRWCRHWWRRTNKLRGVLYYDDIQVAQQTTKRASLSSSISILPTLCSFWTCNNAITLSKEFSKIYVNWRCVNVNPICEWKEGIQSSQMLIRNLYHAYFTYNHCISRNNKYILSRIVWFIFSLRLA